MGTSPIVFEPWHIYSYNRCPILLARKVDTPPPFAKAVRSNMIKIAQSFVDDHIMTTRAITQSWDEDWARIEGGYAADKKEHFAAGGLKKLLAFLTWATNMKKSINYSPQMAGSEIIESLTEEISVKIPLDLIMQNNTLVTFGITGGGRRENPYFSPYSMAQNWSNMVWPKEHFLLDMITHRERITKIRMKQSAGFKIMLAEVLKGVKAHIEQEIIVGRKAATCFSCGLCEGRFFWHASRQE